MFRVGEPIQGRNFNEGHPEKQAGEKFLENMSADEFEKLAASVPSARKGSHTYTRGGKLFEDETFPVFVSKDDYERAVEIPM